ncbi:MAG: DUF2723 domain-containing protein [Anaerolineae bacterium]|nr:DUF2723 domain-containing protein [Anaerolineae bacterium]MDW8098544.1 DUF2723 domain-containing protein [Anaerolineae bacterium]
MKRVRSLLDAGIALGLSLVYLAFYSRTTAPSIVALFDDSLEFQVVLPTLGIAHPTGYPLYTLLGHLFTRLPLGEPAHRANLFSAVTAAATISLLFLAGRELTGRRLAAALAAIQFALIPVWWAQATVAEVYALHGLLQALLLWLTLRWVHDRGRVWPVGLALGLGLAHHRMILLIVPAIALWLAKHRDRMQYPPRSWLVAAGATVTPLLLYAYLPLRGRVLTSLDGTYRNDWAGFWAWVTARDYNVFLTDNPFSLERDARFYLDLAREQIGMGTIGLALLGLIALGLGLVGYDRRQARWDGLCLTVSLAATYGFGLAYQAADVEVFFIPAFLNTSLAVAAGVAAWQAGWEHLSPRFLGASQPLGWAGREILAGYLVLIGAWLIATLSPAIARFPQMDRSRQWEVHELGEDVLSQPMPEGSAIVGILGETTLIRYFQYAHGLRPDVQPVAADREVDRLTAVERLLNEGRPVFLTRPLPGAETRYSLGAVGPLVRVWPKGAAAWDALPGQTNQALGLGIHLIGFLMEVKTSRLGRAVRLTVHWQTEIPIEEPLKVSARLATPTDDKVVAADYEPVHFAYPTTAWLPGEVIQDVYDLQVPPSVAGGTYEVLLILYRAVDGSEIGRAGLGTIELPPPQRW